MSQAAIDVPTRTPQNADNGARGRGIRMPRASLEILVWARETAGLLLEEGENPGADRGFVRHAVQRYTVACGRADAES